MTYEAKTFFSFVDCGAECPHCHVEAPRRLFEADPEWFIKKTCIRKAGHPGEGHLCYKCQGEW